MSNPTLRRRIGEGKRKLADLLAARAESVISVDEVKALAAKLGYRFRVRRWPPWLTVLGFLTQVLEADQSCRNAVAKIWAWLGALGSESGPVNTGSYCDARQRLPEGLIAGLCQTKAQALEALVRPEQRWHGRAVWIEDGSCLSMPDTPENQAAYPQPSVQKKGCGFPVVRIMALFSLATGAILGLQTGSLHVHEVILAHGLWSLVSAGDVLLGDRAFCGFADICLLARRGVDVVVRLHQRRRTDFRRGTRLGKDDHLVTWHKGTCRPGWMSRSAWKRLPETLRLRELRFVVPVRGFRTRTIVVVTTLLDPRRYPREDLMDLYRRRWDCELDLRSVKTVMQMDVLRGRSPAMVRKEIWAHLLAYNQVRTLMWEAAEATGQTVRRLSFKGTLQALNAFCPLFLVLPNTHHPNLYRLLLHWIGRQNVPDRPNRVEPRRVKRRPKPYPLLTQPRSYYQRRTNA